VAAGVAGGFGGWARCRVLRVVMLRPVLPRLGGARERRSRRLLMG